MSVSSSMLVMPGRLSTSRSVCEIGGLRITFVGRVDAIDNFLFGIANRMELVVVWYMQLPAG